VPASTANLQTASTTNTLQTDVTKFQLTFEQVIMGMALVSLDGRILTANPALCRMLGYNEAELTTRTFFAITHPDDVPVSNVLYDGLIDGDVDNYSLDKRYIRKDGSILPAHLVVTLVRNKMGTPLHFISTITAVIPPGALEDADSINPRYRAIFDNLDESMFIVGRSGLLTYATPACTKLLGWTPEELVDEDLYENVFPEDREAVRATLDHFLKPTGKRISIRCRMFHKDGQWIWVDVYAWAVPGPSGPRHEIACVVKDISEYEREHSAFVDEVEQAHARREAEAELALTDQLTGFRNRTAADNVLLAKLNNVRTSAFPVGVLLVDIDHFKHIHNTYGQSVSDTVLKMMAGQIAESCRHDDFMARYSTDQFVIVLPGTNAAGTIICGEKLIRNVRNADWSGSPLQDRLTISIGATCMQHGSGLNVEELMDILQSQLDQAKESGGNRLVMNTRQITGKG
jgi:diguanylate cyclase (GGDEF)-like protein/PAS domain S-box-containing protein